MLTLMRNGGVGMLFVLLFGAVALLAAFYFAVRAERRTLGFVKDMSRATLFATLACTSADIGATLYHSAKVMAAGDRAEGSAMIVEGLAESTSPGILGFSFLGMTAMLTAVGRRRMDERAA